ncbi:hypothetical protein ACWV16_05915 [Achromobacter xylosoxidans]
MTRLLFAFLAGPFWTALFLGLQARLFWREPGFSGAGGQPDWTLMATLLGLLAGAIAMAVLGLPAHRVLRRRGRVTLAPYVLAFTAIGLAGWCAALLIASQFGPGDLRLALYMLADTVVSRPGVPLSAAVLGALVGASFWCIARPDRTAPSLRSSPSSPGDRA